MRSSCDRCSAAIRSYALEIVALAIALIVFVVPFIFIVLIAAKDRPEASHLDFTPADRVAAHSEPRRGHRDPRTD